jgi:4-hydroxy-3-polyprenylbenzoate decarboxylase
MNAMWGAGQMMFNKILVLTDGAGPKIDDYKALTKYVIDNVDPVTDVYFSQGPMDVLDHSCSKLGFGGKMCIDGTKKQPEEIAMERTPYKWDAALSTSAMMQAFPELTGINDKLAREWGIPVLFVAIHKDRMNHVRDIHTTLCNQPGMVGIKMVLYVEHTVKADDIADVLWRFCNNLDPKRDHFFAGASHNILGLDGTRKTKKLDNFDRPWPNIIAADEETIRVVDEKWPSLGLGAKILSPSLRYQTQLYGVGATVLDEE